MAASQSDGLETQGPGSDSSPDLGPQGGFCSHFVQQGPALGSLLSGEPLEGAPCPRDPVAVQHHQPWASPPKTWVPLGPLAGPGISTRKPLPGRCTEPGAQGHVGPAGVTDGELGTFPSGSSLSTSSRERREAGGEGGSVCLLRGQQVARVPRVLVTAMAKALFLVNRLLMKQVLPDLPSSWTWNNSTSTSCPPTHIPTHPLPQRQRSLVFLVWIIPGAVSLMISCLHPHPSEENPAVVWLKHSSDPSLSA